MVRRQDGLETGSAAPLDAPEADGQPQDAPIKQSGKGRGKRIASPPSTPPPGQKQKSATPSKAPPTVPKGAVGTIYQQRLRPEQLPAVHICVQGQAELYL